MLLWWDRKTSSKHAALGRSPCLLSSPQRSEGQGMWQASSLPRCFQNLMYKWFLVFLSVQRVISSQISEDISIQIFIHSFTRCFPCDFDVELANQDGWQQNGKNVPGDRVFHSYQLYLKNPRILPQWNTCGASDIQVPPNLSPTRLGLILLRKPIHNILEKSDWTHTNKHLPNIYKNLQPKGSVLEIFYVNVRILRNCTKTNFEIFFIVL